MPLSYSLQALRASNVLQRCRSKKVCTGKERNAPSNTKWAALGQIGLPILHMFFRFLYSHQFLWCANLTSNLSQPLRSSNCQGFITCESFQSMGVPLVIIHFSRIFPYNLSILGVPPSMETPICAHICLLWMGFRSCHLLRSCLNGIAATIGCSMETPNLSAKDAEGIDAEPLHRRKYDWTWLNHYCR